MMKKYVFLFVVIFIADLTARAETDLSRMDRAEVDQVEADQFEIDQLEIDKLKLEADKSQKEIDEMRIALKNVSRVVSKLSYLRGGNFKGTTATGLPITTVEARTQAAITATSPITIVAAETVPLVTTSTSVTTATALPIATVEATTQAAITATTTPVAMVERETPIIEARPKKNTETAEFIIHTAEPEKSRVRAEHTSCPEGTDAPEFVRMGQMKEYLRFLRSANAKLKEVLLYALNAQEHQADIGVDVKAEAQLIKGQLGGQVWEQSDKKADKKAEQPKKIHDRFFGGLSHWAYIKKVASIIDNLDEIDVFVRDLHRDLSFHETLIEFSKPGIWDEMVEKIKAFSEKKIPTRLRQQIYDPSCGIVHANAVSLAVSDPRWNGKMAHEILDPILCRSPWNDVMESEPPLNDPLLRNLDVNNFELHDSIDQKYQGRNHGRNHERNSASGKKNIDHILHRMRQIAEGKVLSGVAESGDRTGGAADACCH